jgi:hypothetical protein
MAAVRLTRYECERDLLPRVCARCGVPANTEVRPCLHTPFWNVALSVLLVICPPVFLILIEIVLRKRRFPVPMCERDAADWKWRDRFSIISYLIMGVGAYIVVLVLILISPVADRVKELAPLGYLLTIYSWFPVYAIMWTRTVRSTKVMKRGIRLSGLHEDFIRALMADRMRSRESDPARTAWYGDARDDFEEDWNVDGAFRPEVPPECSPQSRVRSEAE